MFDVCFALSLKECLIWNKFNYLEQIFKVCKNQQIICYYLSETRKILLVLPFAFCQWSSDSRSAEANMQSQRRVQEMWNSVWTDLCQTKSSDLHISMHCECLPMQERICQSSKWRLCGAERLSKWWANESRDLIQSLILSIIKPSFKNSQEA